MGARVWTQQYAWNAHYGKAIKAGIKPATLDAIAEGRRPTEMAEDEGMLFIFAQETERSFWMSNTPLSLDILYIQGDGTIRTIAANTTPYSEKSIPSRGPVLYVLEVLGGWAERHGVKSGDRVTLPPLTS